MNNSLYTKVYSLSQLYKIIKRSYLSLIKETLQERPYPSFKEFSSCAKNSQLRFCINDGLKIIEDYVEYNSAYLLEKNPNVARKRKANNQNENLLKKDKNGMLGISIHRPKDPNKKHRKKVQSVWTVKKR